MKKKKKKADEKKEKEGSVSNIFNTYMQNNWGPKPKEPQNNNQQKQPPKKKEVPKPKIKKRSLSPGLIDRLSKNMVRDRSPQKEKSPKGLMLKKSPKKYDPVQFNVLPLKE